MSGTGGTGGESGAPAEACPAATPPVTALQRLTRFEYNNTVRDAFGNDTRPADQFPPDPSVSDHSAPSPPLALIEGYHQAAHDFALETSEDATNLPAFLGCDPADDGEEACRASFLSSFLARAFRRPATAEETSEFLQVFSDGQALGGSFASGVRAVIEVALQSPEFLYRVEFGEPADDRGSGWGRPTPYEMASRLSYLYWGSSPDGELLTAAADGGLRSEEEIAEQASRLLADPNGREVVPHFFARLTGLDGRTFQRENSPDYPAFTSTIAAHMREETALFVKDVVFDGAGDFASLFTAPHTFLSQELAEFYGIAGVTGWQRVELDPAQRAGLLSQGSFLALHPNPSRRGAMVLSALFCVELSAKPVDVSTPPVDEPMTTRQRFELHTQDPACAGCHSLIDPPGFTFGHFDESGVYMETEEGLPIDTAVELSTTDIAGPVSGFPDLVAKIAGSEEAQRCFVEQWMKFGYHRDVTPEDACTRELLDAAFLENGGNVQALLLALSRTEAFRYRALQEVTP